MTMYFVFSTRNPDWPLVIMTNLSLSSPAQLQPRLWLSPYLPEMIYCRNNFLGGLKSVGRIDFQEGKLVLSRTGVIAEAVLVLCWGEPEQTGESVYFPLPPRMVPWYCSVWNGSGQLCVRADLVIVGILVLSISDPKLIPPRIKLERHAREHEHTLRGPVYRS